MIQSSLLPDTTPVDKDIDTYQENYLYRILYVDYHSVSDKVLIILEDNQIMLLDWDKSTMDIEHFIKDETLYLLCQLSVDRIDVPDLTGIITSWKDNVKCKGFRKDLEVHKLSDDEVKVWDSIAKICRQSKEDC